MYLKCRLLSFLLVLTILSSVLVLPAAATVYPAKGKTTAVVYMREAASTESDKVTLLLKGTSLILYGELNGFYNASCDGHSGYVYAKYVRVTSQDVEGIETPPPQQPTATPVITQAPPTTAAPEMTQTPQITATPTAQPATGSSTSYTTMRRGSRGEDVRRLQQALNNLGYDCGVPDGAYGAKTQKAVKAFQRDRNLQADGIAGPATQRALYEQNQPTAAPVATATQTIAPSATPAITATPTPNQSSTPTTPPQTTLQPTGAPTASLPTLAPSATLTATVTNGWLRLRADDSTQSAVLCSIPSGTAILVYAKGNTWCYVTYAGYTGYVMTRYLSFEPAATPTPVTTATPSPTATQTPEPTQTSTPSPTAEPTQNIPDTYVVATINTGALNLRQGPSTAHLILMSIKRGETVWVYEQTGSWSWIQYGDTIGYVMTKYLSFDGPMPSSSPTPTPSTETPAPNDPTTTPQLGKPTVQPDTTLILSAGSRGDQVLLLQYRLNELGYLSGGLTSVYDTATVAAVKKYQKAAKLATDGVAGPLTLASIYSENGLPNTTTPVPSLDGGVGKITPPSASQIKLLHFFNDIKPKYRSGQTVLVYDPASDLAWNLRFYALGRHADSEPLTAKDTLIMYYAFGCTNTWTAKAVWVRLPDGVWSLATMHNVPHLSSSIKDNDFDGHLCVHFLRDMDECKKNDPDYGVSHQNAIRKAWKNLTGEVVE